MSTTEHITRPGDEQPEVPVPTEPAEPDEDTERKAKERRDDDEE